MHAIMNLAANCCPPTSFAVPLRCQERSNVLAARRIVTLMSASLPAICRSINLHDLTLVGLNLFVEFLQRLHNLTEEWSRCLARYGVANLFHD